MALPSFSADSISGTGMAFPSSTASSVSGTGVALPSSSACSAPSIIRSHTDIGFSSSSSSISITPLGWLLLSSVLSAFSFWLFLGLFSSDLSLPFAWVAAASFLSLPFRSGSLDLCLRFLPCLSSDLFLVLESWCFGDGIRSSPFLAVPVAELVSLEVERSSRTRVSTRRVSAFFRAGSAYTAGL